MAVRFNATSGTVYTTTGGLPGTVFTTTFWGMIVVDRNDYSTFFAIGGTNDIWLQTDVDGVTPNVYAGLPGTSVKRMIGTAMTLGAWYKFALVVNGTSSILYQGPAGGTLTATPAVSWVDPSAVTT